MNIIIFGSCVSRDAFDIGSYKNEDLAHIQYFARCSLITLNSPPFNIDVAEIENINPFQQRLVANDLNRAFYSHIAGRDLDNTYLIIDFIDERLDLLFWEGKYITFSEEFENSNLSKKMTGNKIQRSESLTEKVWKHNCLLFIEKISTAFPPEKVILHKAFWKDIFIDNKEYHRFSNIKQIQENNRQLLIYYNFFQLNFPGIQVIDLNKEGYQADKCHKWGLGPIHYTSEYYFRFVEEFDHIVQNRNNKQVQ